MVPPIRALSAVAVPNGGAWLTHTWLVPPTRRACAQLLSPPLASGHLGACLAKAPGVLPSTVCARSRQRAVCARRSAQWAMNAIAPTRGARAPQGEPLAVSGPLQARATKPGGLSFLVVSTRLRHRVACARRSAQRAARRCPSTPPKGSWGNWPDLKRLLRDWPKPGAGWGCERPCLKRIWVTD